MFSKGLPARGFGQYAGDHIHNGWQRFWRGWGSAKVYQLRATRMHTMTARDYIDLAERLANTACDIIRRGRDRLAMEIKSNGRLVTVIDKAVEAALRAILTKEGPGTAFWERSLARLVRIGSSSG
ncbi:MAG: hypothetical protein OSB69_05355 [Alphaproteobacteria bacterium]|nr:hypothetical protein [Alphaproteobacteria bacterium]